MFGKCFTVVHCTLLNEHMNFVHQKLISLFFWRFSNHIEHFFMSSCSILPLITVTWSLCHPMCCADIKIDFFSWKCKILILSLVLALAFWNKKMAIPLTYCCRVVWPRDLCYVRYWRRNDDGSYGEWHRFFPLHWFCLLTNFLVCCHCAVVLFQSREHPNCHPQPGFVRAHVESTSRISRACFLQVTHS